MREKLFHQGRTQIGSAASRLREWFRARPNTQRRLISGGLGLVVVATLALVAAMPAITSASEMNALANGGFEHGFHNVDGCGVVGNQWDCFTNGGAAAYGFYDDQWDATVYEGESSQLIEINTKNMTAGDNDRYAGISQTARVIPGKSYKFSMHGMIRTTNLEGDPWRYTVQVGWLPGPQGDWDDVKNWQEVGWNTYYNRTEPGSFSAYQTQLVPDSEVITIFIRVWKKWGVPYEELDVNLDAIELSGPSGVQHYEEKKGPEEYHGGTGGPLPGQEYRPEQFQPQARPEEQEGHGPQNEGPQSEGPKNEGPQREGPPQQKAYHPEPEDYPVSCGGEELIYNGSFEGGFVDAPWGVAGKGWDAFTNGGAANYGFYDEEWDAVIANGHHGQLIEINSKAVYPTDADRYAGISQRISGLRPGETYELSLRGELRGVGNEDDPYRFAAQWGLGDPSGWESVDEWTTMDLGPIAVRTEPVPLAQYKAQFESPSQGVVLYIRGWKRFAVTNVEMDLNLDAISLRACDNYPTLYPGQGGPEKEGYKPGPDHHEEGEYQGGGQPHGPDQNHPHEEMECYVEVVPGDTLSQIAVENGVSMEALANANGIDDPSTIYVGQVLEIPGCEGEEAYGPANQGPVYQDGPAREWEISQGESPSDIPVSSGPAMGPSLEELANGEATQPLSFMGAAARQAASLTYTVQEGDMLSYIAQEFSVNSFDLATFNDISDSDMIYAGQVLVIPN